jgi:DNA-binding GntR family transcriptional regulator
MDPEHSMRPAYLGHESVQELVASRLREAILSGSFEGGRPLRQAEIAARFGVSSIPVREAFRRLEGEGLVVFYPRRGAVVSKLSADEMREICEMREALEPLALGKALPNMADKDLRRAKEVLDLADKEPDDQLLPRWGEMNWEFHGALYRPAGRPRLLGAIHNLHINFDRYLRLHFSAMRYREKGQQEHREILERCEQRDEEGAVEALRLHIQTVSEMLFGYLAGKGAKGVT